MRLAAHEVRGSREDGEAGLVRGRRRLTARRELRDDRAVLDGFSDVAKGRIVMARQRMAERVTSLDDRRAVRRAVPSLILEPSGDQRLDLRIAQAVLALVVFAILRHVDE